MLSTNWDAGESSGLQRDLVTNEFGWSKRVRPFLAEVVELGDETDRSSFVYRDVVTTIDRRGPNCNPWDFSGERDQVDLSWGNYISSDGIVDMNAAIELAFPYPDIQSPEDFIDISVDGGMAGPNVVNQCILWSEITDRDASWIAIVAALKSAAAAVNSQSGVPVYPAASLDSSWAICSDWDTAFTDIEWVEHDSFVVDTTVDPLLYQWGYNGIAVEMLATPSQTQIGFWRGGAIDTAMSSGASIPDCLIDAVASVDAEQEIDLSGNATGGIDIDSDGASVDASSTLSAAQDHCGVDWFDMSISWLLMLLFKSAACGKMR